MDVGTEGRPARRREHVNRVANSYGISERKMCRALGWPRSSHRYRSQAVDTTPLRATTATLLLDAGADITEVQNLLGHKHVSVTQMYDKRRRSTKHSASHQVPL